jgi:hypothetical protein
MPAKAIRLSDTWYVLYPSIAPVRCHNRSTAEYLAVQYNEDVKPTKEV